MYKYVRICYLSHKGDLFINDRSSDGARSVLQTAVLMADTPSVHRVEVNLLTVAGLIEVEILLG